MCFPFYQNVYVKLYLLLILQRYEAQKPSAVSPLPYELSKLPEREKADYVIIIYRCPPFKRSIVLTYKKQKI